MSLKPEPIHPNPQETARVAKAAFPKGSTFMRMRDELGILYQDEAFATLFPQDGQPALAPWRLALITIMQFAERLPDRQAAEQLTQCERVWIGNMRLVWNWKTRGSTSQC
jgi:transposase